MESYGSMFNVFNGVLTPFNSSRMSFMPELVRDGDSQFDELVNDESINGKLSLANGIGKDVKLPDNCYGSLGGFVAEDCVTTTKNGEYKDGTDHFLEDLDTNVDTTSIPESEFVSEYFDIYSSNDSLNKIYSPSNPLKWDGMKHFPKAAAAPFDGRDLKTIDRLETGIIPSEGVKTSPVRLTTPFFEDDFRYVSSVLKSRPKSPVPMMNESISHTPDARLFNTPDQNVNVDISVIPFKKEEPLKTDWHNNTFDKKRPLMHDIPGDLKRPQQAIFENNTSRVNGHIFDTDLYFIPTLTNKCANLVLHHRITTNYCVYIGADYNRLVCTCNMMHPNGSNSHATSCNVVAGGIELSTESWPISRASHLYASVRNWERCTFNSRGSVNCISKSEFTAPCKSSWYTFDDTKNIFYQPSKIDCSKFQQSNIKIPLMQPYGYNQCNVNDHLLQMSDVHVMRVKDEIMKRGGNTLISEITGIKIDYDDANFARNKHEDSGFHIGSRPLDDCGKRRKVGRARTPLIGSGGICNYNTPVEGNAEAKRNGSDNITGKADVSSDLQNANKTDKKGPIHHNHAEKVSGVWYDTNRHLWRVVYMKGNKRKTQGFSSLKLGYEEARRKAIQMRHEMVALRHNDKI